MSLIHDDELINHPALRSAMAAQRATDAEPLRTRSRHWLIGWLIIVVAIGVPLIVLIGLIHLAG